jgi:hypothetical protein
MNFIKNQEEVALYQPDRVRARLAFKAAFNAGKF